MNRVMEYVKTVKWWAGLLGAGFTGAAGYADAPSWVIGLGGILTAIAVWELPYQPSATSKSVDASTTSGLFEKRDS